MNVVVRVPSPYVATSDRDPLLVGTFTEVTIPGRRLDRYFDVPRSALRESSAIWIVEGERLVMRKVNVVQEVEDRVTVTSQELPDTFELVLNNLAIVTDGMTVRTNQQ
jgi:hypothetical protein